MAGQPNTGQQQGRYAKSAYGTNYYPYPASYSYYPTRTYPYRGMKPKSLYPLVLILAGLLLVGLNFVKVEKLDSKISRIVAIGSDTEIAAVVFCSPCDAVNGESVGQGKVMVVGDAISVSQIAELSGVKQVKLLGTV